MALTQQQWLEKLKRFVPEWFYEEELYQDAYAQGLALILSLTQLDADEHFAETFLLQASGDFIDEQGYERDILRTDGEFDNLYRERVRRLANQSNCPDIKSLVDELLQIGEAEIIEDFEASLFANRGVHLNRNVFLIDEIYNGFSIIVDKQIHAPYSFLDREYFLNREDFTGQAESSQFVFDLLVEAVNKVKACGIFYRVIERSEG
jgi:hypothetical protein